MLEKYKKLKKLTYSKYKYFLCNLIEYDMDDRHLLINFKQQLRKIDETDPDLWEKRPSICLKLTPDKMVDDNNPF